MKQEQLDFDDIFGLWELAWWQKPWVWLVIVVVTSVVGILLWRAYKRYRSRKIILAPREHALQQLKFIKPASLATADEYKHFYVTLFGVVKEYFDARYHLACSSKTDRELVFYAAAQYQIAHHQALIEHLVNHGSMVKFARDNATIERVVADYEMVEQMLLHEPLPEKNHTPS